MTRDDMLRRTKQFGLRTIRAVRALPNDDVARVLGRQLLRSGTSVGANYRAACRSRSKADFVAKLKIVEEECDESAFWMEMLSESDVVPATKFSGMLREADEILAIVVASIITLRRRIASESLGSRRPVASRGRSAFAAPAFRASGNRHS